MLENVCQLLFIPLATPPTCSSGPLEAVWERRKATFPWALKISLIKPLRFNGDSSWLINNLFFKQGFIWVFLYANQRLQREDQRFQIQLCFESKNSLLCHHNREGFLNKMSQAGFSLPLDIFFDALHPGCINNVANFQKEVINNASMVCSVFGNEGLLCMGHRTIWRQ